MSDLALVSRYLKPYRKQFVLAALEMAAFALADAALVAAAAFAVHDLRGLHLAARQADHLVALLVGQKPPDDGDVGIGHHGRQFHLAVSHREARQLRDETDGRGLIALSARPLQAGRYALVLGQILHALTNATDDLDGVACEDRIEAVLDHDPLHVGPLAAAQHVGGDPVLPAGRQVRMAARSGAGARWGDRVLAHGPD